MRTGNVQMVQSDVIFEENIEDSYVNLTETVNDDSSDWVILDSGSDVSLLPLHFVADKGSNNNHLLRDCQGGSLAVTGTRYTDLQVEDVSGEEVVLRHEFVVGDVTTSLISLGQLYQLGWRIGDSDGQLCLGSQQEGGDPCALQRKVICTSSSCTTHRGLHGFLCQNRRAGL